MKPLAEYQRKRNFKQTPEPGMKNPKTAKSSKLIFVVQEHHASHLHYDFRLEWKGVLKSWAVPKGPSLDPGQKRLAVEVEDHPRDYAKFEGIIPAHQYGAGEVFRWDYGTWQPTKDPDEGLRKGRLEFSLKGKKLRGAFVLVRTRGSSGKANWLLIKRHDQYVIEGQPPTPARKPEKSPLKRHRSLAATKFPAFIPPHLAVLVDRPPQGSDWVHEIKFDGYRTEAHLNKGQITLFTRSGKDWTKKYPAVVKRLKKLGVASAVLDGEVVWVEDNGRTNFQKLQRALKEKKTARLVYYLFDLLYLDGKDLTSLPLIARKERLFSLVKKLDDPQIRYSEHYRGLGADLMQASCAHDLEGIVSKRVDTPYTSGRHDDWVKSKCIKRQEFVVGGFSEGEGSRTRFGALLLGVYDHSKLRYVGRCGTGFDGKTLRELSAELRKIETTRSPFQLKSPRGRDIHWVKPKLVVEIKFSEWTADKILRMPVFYGLRADKSPIQIIEEKPRRPPVSSPKSNLSHPDKLIYAKEKITKQEVADYYEEVSDWLLPHVENRPLSLLKCPQGAGKTCFFAKHWPAPVPPGIIEIPQKSGESPWFTIHSKIGLRALVQRGTLEIHPWGCHRETLEFPDQIVMDFDPDAGLDFERVKEGALELRDMLLQLRIRSYLKVTGGKGLHVQFPIEPIYTWEQIKDFAKTLALEMASRKPKLYTANLLKKSRKGKIFIDYLRNGSGATAVAPYSLRDREPSSVAMPLAWEALGTLSTANGFTLRKVLEHLRERRADPWKNYFSSLQKISILKGKR